MNIADAKKFRDLCIKITNMFETPYILKTGFVISLDIEEPYLIQLDEDQIKLFEEFNNNTFQILNIFNIRDFKKALADHIEDAKASNDTEIKLDELMKSLYTTELANSLKKKVLARVSNYTDLLKEVSDWTKFKLSNDDRENESLILKIFKQNDFTLFIPNGSTDNVPIIFTKSLLPMISEKNYDIVSYATMLKNDDLHLLIFESKLPLFVAYMFHYYIPFE